MPAVKVPDWATPLLNQTKHKPPRYFATYGGRGGSKSWSIAHALICRAAGQKIRVLCARETQRSIKDSVKRLLDDSIERLGVSDQFESTREGIKCPRSGSSFIFAGLRDNVDAIRSMEGIGVCWISEAQRISQNSLDIVIPTIRAKDSQIIFDWNPRFPNDPVDKMFRQGDPPPNSMIININYDDNPDFPEVLKDEMLYDQRRDPDKYQHIWLGGYLRNSESRVFRNWRIEEFEADPGAAHRFGADWGFAIDPTVLVRCHIVGRTLYVDHEAYRVGCDIIDTPLLFLSVPEAERWPIVADSSRPETISHMQKSGFPRIIGAVKGPKSVEEGVEWLKSYDIVVHPRCKHVIDELSLYSYKTDKNTGEILPLLEDKHNHVIDALRYAVEGVRRLTKKEPVRVDAIPTANRW